MHGPKKLILEHPKLFVDISRALCSPTWFGSSRLEASEIHFGYFQWPIPRLIFSISWALAQKCCFWSSQYLFFGISWLSAWPKNVCFEIPETHVGNFLGPWSEIFNFKFKRIFFAFFHLAADLSCANPAFSKHVDNHPIFWQHSLAVVTVSLLCLYVFLLVYLSTYQSQSICLHLNCHSFC